MQIYDTVYELDTAYRRGAMDCREGLPQHNPHRIDSYAHDQYDNGYQNEDETGSLHTVDGIDVITRKRLA